MALCRAFSKVDEDGHITLPNNVLGLLKVKTGEDLIIHALRIKCTTRYPHAVLFKPVNHPKLSALELVMGNAFVGVDDRGQVILPSNILEEMKLKKDYRVEMKVQGPHNGHWLMLYNRGPWTETTLRQRMGVNRGKSDIAKRKTMTWDY
ncbi:MAG: hypothetical protein H8E61_05350 [Bacteroidetes bacterium]|nr:hypothetical protein [Bacteroidota bacterium]